MLWLQNATMADPRTIHFPGQAAGAQSAPLDLTQQPLRFLNAYWTLWQVLSERVNAELVREHDLDLRAFIALSYLQGGLSSPSDLSRRMVIPKYEVTRTLSRLSRLSAIDRRGDPSNARRQHLSVTAAGQGLWASALATVQAVTQPPASHARAAAGRPDPPPRTPGHRRPVSPRQFQHTEHP